MTAQPDIQPDIAPRKHRWDYDHERRLSGIDTADGNDRNERDCLHCGMVKITVHYPSAHGFPGREWRTKDGKVWVGVGTPPCLGTPA